MEAHDVEQGRERFCFAWFEHGEARPGANKAALQRDSMWTPGDVISVSFLDGDPDLWDMVEEAAQLWTGPGLANLTFDFRRDTNDTLIRISFQYEGSWSVIGTSCKQIKDQPTMNFGWLRRGSNKEDVESVVLHEFGHALGLIHEHQHPANGIDWDKDAVYKALSGPPNNWKKDTIDFNMFEAYSKDATNYSRFDPSSIMMYSFPASWTHDGFRTDLNVALSPTDKRFIHKQYP